MCLFEGAICGGGVGTQKAKPPSLGSVLFLAGPNGATLVSPLDALITYQVHVITGKK